MDLHEKLDSDELNLNKSNNVGIVKQEALEADDLPLQYEVLTSKSENTSTDDQLASTSLNTFDADGSLGIKLETMEQDCWHETVKVELLHAELDIKREGEATQETPVDEKHNLGNSKVKPFKCNICDQTFRQKGNLKIHLRAHSGEKPFKCNFCDYSSGRNNDLKEHLRTHTGEKLFKCYICNYSCVRKGTLKRHLTTHTEEKPYKCTVCNYSCASSFQLKIHLRTHTGEKPFKCTVCNYSCVASSQLKIHLKSHSGDKPFKCSICDYSSAHRSNLMRHLRHTHVS